MARSNKRGGDGDSATANPCEPRRRCRRLQLGGLAVCLAVALTRPVAATGTLPPMTLSLDQAIAMAVERATSVVKAGLGKEVSGAQLAQAYAQFLPNLATTAGAGYAIGNNFFTQGQPTLVNGKDYGGNLQVTSSINVFNGFSDQASLKAALAKDAAAQWSLERAREQIAIDVTQAYMQLVLDGELVAIAQKNLEVSKSRQVLLEEQTRIGAKDLATLYRQQAQTSADASSLIQAANKYNNDAILLTRRLRLDPGQELKLVPPPLDKPGARYADQPVETLVQIATTSRKDLKAASSLADAANLGVTNARGGYYPHLDLGVTAGTTSRTLITHEVNGANDLIGVTQQPEFPQLADHWLYTLGLTMTWAIFDRGVVHYQVEHAAADAKSAALDRDDFLLQVEGEVRQACGDYLSATRRLKAADEGLKAAKAAFEAVDGRYQVGAASFIDLTTSQTQLAEAEQSRAQAETDVFLQARLIDHYVGAAH